MMGVDEGGDITMPDFSGKTMREVTDDVFATGVGPGTGWQQSCYGTDASRRNEGEAWGPRITVQFGMPSAPKPASSMKPRKSSKR